GPANRRTRVSPWALPTATPRTATLSLASLGLLASLGTSRGLLSVTTTASLGASGMKTAAKYWSAAPAHRNGPLKVSPPEIHFLPPVRNHPDVALLCSMLPFRCQSILELA